MYIGGNAFGIGAAGALGVASFGATLGYMGVAGASWSSLGVAGSAGALNGVEAGMGSTALSTTILNQGNHHVLGDPLMSPAEYATTIAIGGMTGGIAEGLSSLANGRNVWNGNFTKPGQSPWSFSPNAYIKGSSNLEKLSIPPAITNQELVERVENLKITIDKIEYYDVGDGVHRSKATYDAGHKVIKAVQATDPNTVMEIPIENLRFNMKSTIDLSTPKGLQRWENVQKMIKSPNYNSIYVNPTTSPIGPTIKDINFKK